MPNNSINFTNKQYLDKSYNTNSREELIKLYDEWAEDYDLHAAERSSAQPKHVASLFLELIDDSQCKILDVGAGTGLIGQILKEHGFIDLSALDPSAEMLNVAKSKNIYHTYYQEYLGDQLSLDVETFDAIVASGIFTTGHVSAPAFSELYRVLKPRGKFIFSINSNQLHTSHFSELINNIEHSNWTCDQITPEFNMMNDNYSLSKAVVVALTKQTKVK